MNSRWMPLLCLSAFGLLLGGIWTYLSNLDRQLADDPPAAVATPSDSESSDFFGTPFRERAAISRMRGPNSRRGPGAVGSVGALARMVPALADRLDEESVRVRGDLGRRTPVQLSAALEAQHSGCYAAAIARYEEVLSQSPRLGAALSGKASCLAALGRSEEAARVFREAAFAAPRDPIIHYNYGVLLTRLARYGEAADEFRTLVALDPGHAEGQYNLASLAQRAGRLIEARDAWAAFTALQPDEPSGWFNLGITWMDFDEPIEAIRSFSVYAALAPDDPVGRTNLALAYAAAGDLWTALDLLVAAQGAWPCDESIASSLEEIVELVALHPPMEEAVESFLSISDEDGWNSCGLLPFVGP